MAIRLLDCTLRDGGYLNDCAFGEKTIQHILTQLPRAGIHTIECGFLIKGCEFNPNQTYYSCLSQINSLLPETESQYVMFCDGITPFAKSLEAYSGKGIRGLRVGIFHHLMGLGLEKCREIKEKGYDVYIQAVDTLSYTTDELLELIQKANEFQAKTMAIVDSYGAMIPKELPPLIETFEKYLDPKIALGFHAHNNKQLAFALSIQAMECTKRDLVIDGTLYGMGRGAGNTPLELLVEYLNQNHGGSYNLDILLQSLDDMIHQLKGDYSWGYSVPNFIAGIYGSHIKNISYLQSKGDLASQDLFQLLNMLDSDKLKRYDYDALDKIYNQYCTRLKKEGK